MLYTSLFQGSGNCANLCIWKQCSTILYYVSHILWVTCTAIFKHIISSSSSKSYNRFHYLFHLKDTVQKSQCFCGWDVALETIWQRQTTKSNNYQAINKLHCCIYFAFGLVLSDPLKNSLSNLVPLWFGDFNFFLWRTPEIWIQININIMVMMIIIEILIKWVNIEQTCSDAECKESL